MLNMYAQYRGREKYVRSYRNRWREWERGKLVVTNRGFPFNKNLKPYQIMIRTYATD